MTSQASQPGEAVPGEVVASPAESGAPGGPARSEAIGRAPRFAVERPSLADRLFRGGLLSSGLAVLVLLAAIGLFLLWQSRHAFGEAGFSFFSRAGFNPFSSPPKVGVLGLLVGTCVTAAIAVPIAVPLAVCAALFITEYAPVALRKVLQGVIDLLAAVPSLLFGLWGFLYLGNQVAPLESWMGNHLSFIPFMRTSPAVSLIDSYFIAGLVIAMMVLPITASVVREVFAQTPASEKEAALALGGTHWGMVRTVVLPFGRGGIVGGAMLGLGRALGETIAAALLLPQVPSLLVRIYENGGSTIAGFIADRAGSPPFETSALMAAGLVLFVLTLAVNMGTSAITARSRSGAGVEV